MTTLQEVRARFARDQSFPFAESLNLGRILGELVQHGVEYRDRLFNYWSRIMLGSTVRAVAPRTSPLPDW